MIDAKALRDAKKALYDVEQCILNDFGPLSTDGSSNLRRKLAENLRGVQEQLVIILHEAQPKASHTKSRSKRNAKTNPMTPELAQKILDFGRSHPDWTKKAIADRFNVNSGRVSEILNNTNRYGAK